MINAAISIAKARFIVFIAPPSNNSGIIVLASYDYYSHQTMIYQHEPRYEFIPEFILNLSQFVDIFPVQDILKILSVLVFLHDLIGF